jgi:ferredoxin
MVAVAAMEWNGIPIDVPTLEHLRKHWPDIQDDLIAEIDKDYGVFDGRTYKTERWARWLSENNIPWPRLESGQLDMSDDTFRQMAKSYPRCRQCASCVTRCPPCGWPILRWAAMVAIERSSQPSGHGLAVISRQIPNSFLVRAFG